MSDNQETKQAQLLCGNCGLLYPIQSPTGTNFCIHCDAPSEYYAGRLRLAKTIAKRVIEQSKVAEKIKQFFYRALLRSDTLVMVNNTMTAYESATGDKKTADLYRQHWLDETLPEPWEKKGENNE